MFPRPQLSISTSIRRPAELVSAQAESPGAGGNSRSDVGIEDDWFDVTLNVDPRVMPPARGSRPDARPAGKSKNGLIQHQLCFQARSGQLRISPRRIRCRAEPLLPQTRADVEDTWGVTVHNDWVCTEGASAATCGAGHGMHLSEDLVIIEPVDAAGDLVPAGVPAGKVYLTILYNLAVPLIRYELTDQMSFLGGDCPCGTVFARIADLQGRTEDLFHYGPDIQVHPHVFRSALGREPRVIEYQVRQTPAGADITVVTDGRIDARRIGQQISAALSQLGLTEPVINIASAAALDRTATGKLRRFTSLPPPASPTNRAEAATSARPRSDDNAHTMQEPVMCRCTCHRDPNSVAADPVQVRLVAERNSRISDVSRYSQWPLSRCSRSNNGPASTTFSRSGPVSLSMRPGSPAATQRSFVSAVSGNGA